jgi:hypothetical protein
MSHSSLSLFTGTTNTASTAANTTEEAEEAPIGETYDNNQEEEGAGADHSSSPRTTSTADSDDDDDDDDNNNNNNNKAEGELQEESESIANIVKKMTITETVFSSLKLPVFVYEYKDEKGFTFVTADALMLSGSCVKDVEVLIDSTGRFITVT